MNSQPKTLPQLMNNIMGDLVKTWTEVNAEACRQIKKYNTELDQFLFMNRDQQNEYLRSKNIKFPFEDKAVVIESQISKLKKEGMLPTKKA